VARSEVEERVLSWRGQGASVRASASASRRFCVVLKALAELGHSVPGSAEPSSACEEAMKDTSKG
jgi:hypothetical protein